jgi:hypothetical protein
MVLAPSECTCHIFLSKDRKVSRELDTKTEWLASCVLYPRVRQGFAQCMGWVVETFQPGTSGEPYR